MKTIHFVTSNKGKFHEASRILGARIEKMPLGIDEIQEVNVRKVAERKLDDAYGIARKPVVVEDTGLYIRELNGFPGALVKHLEERIGVEGMIRMLAGYRDRQATAETVVGFRDSKGRKVFVSVMNGRIARKARGRNGFGFDSIFIPEGSDKTLAEMDVDEKNGFTARGKSFRKLGAWLDRNRS